MTWYFWVWGVASTLALGSVTLLASGFLVDQVLARRNRGVKIQNLERDIVTLQARLHNANDQIRELLKKENRFGRISP